MKKELPEYMVNCLSVAGFDNIYAVCSMTFSPDERNSIDKIEEYIEKRKKYLPSCLGPHYLADTSLPFEFPPGHKILLENFVLQFKEAHPSICNKYTHSIGSKNKCTTNEKPSKKPKVIPTEDIPTVSNDVRRKVSQWLASYNNGEFADCKEGEDYEIVVRRSSDLSTSECTVAIKCHCSRSEKSLINVQRRQTGTNQWSITNWSKHFKNCKKKIKKQDTQDNLHSFFLASKSNGIVQPTTSSVNEIQPNNDESDPISLYDKIPVSPLTPIIVEHTESPSLIPIDAMAVGHNKDKVTNFTTSSGTSSLPTLLTPSSLPSSISSVTSLTPLTAALTPTIAAIPTTTAILATTATGSPSQSQVFQ